MRFASGVSAGFQRIQITPDLMPGDLTGSEAYEPAAGTFRFVLGLLFHDRAERRIPTARRPRSSRPCWRPSPSTR